MMKRMCCLNKNILLFVLPLLLAGINNAMAQTEAEKADSLKKAGNYKEALFIYTKLLEADIEQSNTKEQCKDYNNIANVYCRMGSYDESTKYYFKALQLAEKQKDSRTEAVINYNIGMNYITMHQDSFALAHITRAIEILLAENKPDATLGDCYNVLSGIYQSKLDYKNALRYLKLAEDIFKKEDDKDLLANVYVNISNLELDEGNYASVNEYAQKALALFKSVNDATGVAACYINLMSAHYSVHEDPTGVNYKKEMQRCIDLLDSAFTAVKDISSPEYFITIYGNKAQVYGFTGNTDSAYFYLQKHTAFKDSVYEISKQEQIQRLRVQYEADRKEQENLLLQKESQNKNYLLVILATVLIAIVIFSFLSFRIYRLQSKQKALQLEQRLLRLQMNPHFLFNAINSIQNYILKKSQQEAYDYLAKFAKLIRIVLNNSQEKTLTLHDELEMIDLYIELEQLRFNNSFDFKLNVDKNINEFEISVPPMLIQPYIENAIWHGLMNLEKERKGVLNVDISESKGILKIVIEDNGIGRVKAKEYKKEDTHRSVGMKLTEQRLLMINQMQEYENAKVIVTDLKDDKGVSCGTRVKISIPVNGK